MLAIDCKYMPIITKPFKMLTVILQLIDIHVLQWCICVSTNILYALVMFGMHFNRLHASTKDSIHPNWLHTPASMFCLLSQYVVGINILHASAKDNMHPNWWHAPVPMLLIGQNNVGTYKILLRHSRIASACKH
jgi:hypothetical protein